MYKRSEYQVIKDRIKEPRRFIQVVMGPRQVEKSTVVKQVLMIGSLQDAGKTATLAGYLNLLNESGLLGGLQKFGMDTARRKASIPKLQI